MIEGKIKLLEKGLESAQKFIENICSPASTELGLFLKDGIRVWRLNNIIRIINKSSGKLGFENDELVLKASPRVVSEIIDKGSWQENDEIQEMWAGLLISSLDTQGTNDENIVYVNLLNQLTIRQVKTINYFAKNSPKTI